MSANSPGPLVGIVMGSRSDWDTMQPAAERLAALGVPHEVRVVSAHRTPDAMFAYAEEAQARGLRAIIEEVLLNVMYDVPSREDVAKVILTREVVEDGVAPTMVPRETKKKKSA